MQHKAMPEYTAQAAYALCKAQSAECGAFSEELLQHWFAAALQLCATFVGVSLIPPQTITETIEVDWERGIGQLTHAPNGPVRLFGNGVLAGQVPAHNKQVRIPAALCCCMDACVQAQYWVGESGCAEPPLDAALVQAVARVFSYMVEHRGDEELDECLLHASGAFRFLADRATYVW